MWRQSWCTRGFFSPLSTSTEITQPEKSAQNDILCTSARCQSAHLPRQNRKSLIFPSRAGWHQNNRVKLSHLCCSRWNSAWNAAGRIKKRGEKGVCTCPHALMDAKKEKKRVWMCHFKEGWWAGRSSQAGGEELAEQVWRLQRSQLLSVWHAFRDHGK